MARATDLCQCSYMALMSCKIFGPRSYVSGTPSYVSNMCDTPWNEMRSMTFGTGAVLQCTFIERCVPVKKREKKWETLG